MASDKYDPQKYLRPTFSPRTQIRMQPVAVVTASVAQRVNRRIALSISKFESERNDEAASRLITR